MNTDLLTRARGRLYRVLCVDPGLGGTGLAFWRKLSFPRKKAEAPDDTLLLQAPGRGEDWFPRAVKLRRAFARALRVWKPQHLVIETQQVWSGSATSMASATGGDLFKLTLLTGLLVDAAMLEGIEVHLTAPGEWKGQLSKGAVERRIRRALGPQATYDDHIADAVGMGLAVQRRL